MRAGSLRHRITIQQASETNSGEGVTTTWSPFARVQAAIEPLGGREFETAKQTYGQVSHRLRIRHKAGVIPKMRVIRGVVDASGEPGEGARTFEIQGVVNLEERGKEMHLFCTEHV